MRCFFGHKFVEMQNGIICEKCGKKWYEGVEKKEKENTQPAVILKKTPINLEEILKNENISPK